MTQHTHTPPDKPIALLFSGGRDSSLAACLLAVQNHEVHLLRFSSGLGVKADLSDYRLQELIDRFPANIVAPARIPIFGLVRSIALKNIEDDFAKYRVNLILLGESLAMYSAAIVYCLMNGIPTLADGTTGYQQTLPEQMPIAIARKQKLGRHYGMEFRTPVIDYKHEDEVKYQLLEFGISTKSLEGISMFAETCSEPESQQVSDYIAEKLPLCHSYIELMAQAYLKRVPSED